MNTKLIRHLQKRGCRDTAVPPGFECEITDKGIIIKKFTGLNPNPRIESEYGGVPVIAISEEAFKNNRNIETVNIPEGITEIGEMVFGDCNRLTSITIPDSVTKIGIYAFGDCESLVTIDIPDSLTEIGHNRTSCIRTLHKPDFGHDPGQCNKNQCRCIPKLPKSYRKAETEYRTG